MAKRDDPKDPNTTDTSETPDIVEVILAEPVAESARATSAPELASMDSVQPKSPTRNGVFLPALSGGVIAAGIGFALSHFNILGLAPAPQDLLDLGNRLSATEATLSKTDAAFAELRATSSAPDPEVLSRISALETAAARPDPAAALDAMTARLDALETQLVNAPSGGTGVSAAAFSALQAEVRAFKSAGPMAAVDLSALVEDTNARLAEAEAKAEALTSEAEKIATEARAAAALGQLRAALDTGQPYTAPLAMLSGSEVPATLSDYAQTGLPTLANLQASFPQAARAALEAALRANMGESWTDRVATFLRSQTGARSLTPREGSDPDAILSRAEAALAGADLDSALQEIATLPADARTAMADWTGLAERRRAAALAIDALAAKSGG